MTKTYYPVGLDLEGKLVLVVGGGKIAEGKVEQLLECGARVRLVSPSLTPRLTHLADQRALDWHAREFAVSDVGGAWIIIGATDDRAVNAQVAAAGREAGRLVNAVDDVPNCDFIATSVVRRGDLQVSISTGGGSPAMARWVREGMEALVPEEYGPLLELLAGVRAEIRSDGGVVPAYDAWRRGIDAALPLLALGLTREARAALFGALRPAATGHVYLVGAGPGDPGLLTLRGRELLVSADAVVYDHLVDSRVLALARPDAELQYVGKEAGHHALPQEQINNLLVALARQGRVVVRLKGGDPFLFGRGGEEMVALAAVGIPCEVVPGVSAALAAPAAAGIPVTHRGLAQSVAVVTGHCAGAKEPDWAALARSGATLVVLMGVGNLPHIAARLIAAGRSPDTAVAVVERATQPDQRTLIATLADAASRAAEAGIAAPATIVIGDVVAMRQRTLAQAALEVTS